MTREINALSTKKKELAEKYQLKTDREDKLVKELIAVENECEKVHKKLKDAVGNVSNENTQVQIFQIFYESFFFNKNEILQKLTKRFNLNIKPLNWPKC